MKAIEVKGLKKSFGAKEVLREVNLTVERGEILVFLGRNGAGKSTFISNYDRDYTSRQVEPSALLGEIR